MKVIKDSVIYLLGELISKAMPFLLLPYLSRKLGVEGYGELAYYQTFLGLFLIIISLSQEGAVARYFYFYGKRSLTLIVATGYAYTVLVGSIIVLSCWFVAKSELLVYLAISAIFQSFLNVQLSVRQCQKQAISYILIQIFNGFLSVFLTIVFLEIWDVELVEKRILAILISYILTFFVSYLFYTKAITKKKTFSSSQYKLAFFYIIGFGIPLLFHNVSGYLKGQLDRVFIYHHFSEFDLGLYAMGAQIASILMILIHSLNKAILPYLFEGLKNNSIQLKQIHKLAMIALLFVPLPSIIMNFIPNHVITWLLGEQFLQTKYYISIFLASTMLVVPYLLLVNYLFYYGENKLIAICSILSTAIYILSLVFLSKTEIKYLPFAGMIGAVSILPILYFMTLSIEKRLKNDTIN